MKTLSLSASLVILGGLGFSALAQETVSETDAPPPPPPAEVIAAPAPPPVIIDPALATDKPAIPVPYDAARYEKTWAKNPFLLKTVVPQGPKTSWAQDWALAGMFNNEGKIRVSMVNKQTGEYKHLSNQGNPDPEFQLIKANFNRDRTKASADIAKGSDEQTIKYDENLTSKPVTINNTQHVTQNPNAANPNVQRGVVPGKPGAAPVNRNGVPGTPGGVNPNGMPPTGIGGVNGATANANNVNPNAGPVPPAANVSPSISRRRQLVPSPVAPPQQ